jgi:hypothetical protein
VGPRAVLDAVVKRKIPSPRRESNQIILHIYRRLFNDIVSTIDTNSTSINLKNFSILLCISTSDILSESHGFLCRCAMYFGG